MHRWMTHSLIGICALAVAARGGDVYVDDDANPALSDGSMVNPYISISLAAANAQPSDTILVFPGDYDDVVEGGFPIDLGGKNLTIMAQNTTSQSTWPRVGGNADDSTVRAVFDIDLTDSFTGPVTRQVNIHNIVFVGENSAGKDAPSAILIRTDNFNTVEGEISNNLIERSEMNASGANGRAAITLLADFGVINVTISDNTIEPTRRGGIEGIVDAGTNKFEDSWLMSAILRNTITNTGGHLAEFGIRFGALGPSTTLVTQQGFQLVNDNTITSTSNGIGVGVLYEPDEGADFGQTNFDGNVISGCAGDGFSVICDGDGSNNEKPECSLLSFRRNEFYDNGGSGVRLRWDDPADSSEGSGYIVLNAGSCVFAGNGEYGIEYRGFGLDSSNSRITVDACTFADNTYGAEGYFDLELGTPDPKAAFLERVAPIDNCIVYGNNGGGDQVAGLSTFLLDERLDLVRYCDWQGIHANGATADASGNIAIDPLFVSSSTNDYHISSTSPCLDAGRGVLSDTTMLDLDNETRVQDGDDNGTASIDMGADEIPDPTP